MSDCPKKIKQQPNGTYTWSCPIEVEYHRSSMRPGIYACIGIAVFILIFGGILAYIVVLIVSILGAIVSGIQFLITLLLFVAFIVFLILFLVFLSKARKESLNAEPRD